MEVYSGHLLWGSTPGVYSGGLLWGFTLGAYCGSTIHGQWILELEEHIPLGVYSGVYSRTGRLQFSIDRFWIESTH